LDDFGTPLRMAEEHITVHFGQTRSRVRVEFTFENTSDENASCTAGFPDEDLLARYADFGPKDKQGQAPGEHFGNTIENNDTSGASLNDASVLTDFKAWTRPAGSAASANQPLATHLIR